MFILIDNKVRFKQLVIADRGYTLHTIRYSYDSLARLREARYAPGVTGGAADADLLRRYQYAFDLSGNRTQQITTIAGSTTTTNYGYNAANQMTSAVGATLTYDNNGNLTNDGTTAYTWDRANRMLSAGGTSYAYEGMGNRVKQTVAAMVNEFLLDLQPSLAVVLSNTSAGTTSRFVHMPRGIHAQKDTTNNWEWMLQDGLGSVRGMVDNANAVLWSGSYDPFGTSFGATGTAQTTYGFTGERYDAATDLLYLRARHYKPGAGVFTSLDPFEGMTQRPMSLNGYGWVEGNVINRVDPSGLTWDLAKNINTGFCKPVSQGQSSCACYGSIAYLCLNGQLPPCATPALSPTVTPVQTVTIYFGGRGYTDIQQSNPGLYATPLDFTIAQAPTWSDLADIINIFPNETTKAEQASAALNRDYSGVNVRVIGYSAGADAAVLFADQFTRQGGQITDLAVLGGTMTAQGTNLETDWRIMFQNLLTLGVDIYVLDDSAGDDPVWSSFNGTQFGPGSYILDQSGEPHIDYNFSVEGSGVNNNRAIMDRVLTWLDNN